MTLLGTDIRAALETTYFNPRAERLSLEKYPQMCSLAVVQRGARGNQRAFTADIEHFGVGHNRNGQLDLVSGSESRMPAALTPIRRR